MWARISELLFAAWLILSRFIFNYPPEQTFLTHTDLITGLLIVCFSLLSFHSKWPKAHFANFLIALWFIFIAFSFPDPFLPPPLQNYLVIAFLLIIFGIVPSRVNEPTSAWKNFLNENKK